MDPAARRTTPGETRRRAPLARVRATLALLTLALTLTACSRAPAATRASPGAPSVVDAGEALAVPPASGPASDVFMGRKIAPVMGFGGAGWLDRADRERTEEPEKALDALTLARGMTVADIGAGTGYFTLRIARRVGPEGHVIASDIDKRMLDVLTNRADEASLSNIETRLATEDDTRLAPASLDLALMVDVYHELSHPAAELAAIRRALRPAGRLALVEYRGEDPAVAIKPEHKMTRAQIEAEVLPAGYHEVLDYEELRDQRILVFTPAADGGI